MIKTTGNGCPNFPVPPPSDSVATFRGSYESVAKAMAERIADLLRSNRRGHSDTGDMDQLSQTVGTQHYQHCLVHFSFLLTHVVQTRSVTPSASSLPWTHSLKSSGIQLPTHRPHAATLTVDLARFRELVKTLTNVEAQRCDAVLSSIKGGIAPVLKYRGVDAQPESSGRATTSTNGTSVKHAIANLASDSDKKGVRPLDTLLGCFDSTPDAMSD